MTFCAKITGLNKDQKINHAKNKHQRKNQFYPHGPATEEELYLYDEAVFAWTAPNTSSTPKQLWYAVEAAAAALLLIYAMLSGNYTMALALLVLAAVYHYLHEKHPPKTLKLLFQTWVSKSAP